MAHEHQRSDRDDYIVVKPEKIGDFEEVSMTFIKPPKQTTPLLTLSSATSALTQRALE